MTVADFDFAANGKLFGQSLSRRRDYEHSQNFVGQTHKPQFLRLRYILGTNARYFMDHCEFCTHAIVTSGMQLDVHFFS